MAEFTEVTEVMGKKLSIEYINERIEKEKCSEVIESLSDESLIETYKSTPSVTRNMNTLKTILERHNVSEEQQTNIIKDYVLEL